MPCLLPNHSPAAVGITTTSAERNETLVKEHRIATQGTAEERATLAKQKQGAVDAAWAQLATARAR
jgi:hypothetical protein